MQYIMWLLSASGLFLLWLKIKSFFLEKKVQKETAELQKAKENANEKVTDANSAYTTYEQRLRQYRDKKTDSDSR